MTENPGRQSLVTPLVAVLLIGAGASYVVGGAGYGLAAEYGSLADGGLWQVVAIGAVVVGSVWAALTLLLLHVNDRRANGFAVVVAAVAVCLAAGIVGGQVGSASHAERTRSQVPDRGEPMVMLTGTRG